MLVEDEPNLRRLAQQYLEKQGYKVIEAADGPSSLQLLERNPQAGGLPRFCTHPGWGMLDLGRFLSGPVGSA